METARDMTIYENLDIRKVFSTNKRRSRSFNFSNYLVILVIFFCISFFQVTQQALVAQDAVTISNLQSELRSNKNLNEKMRIESEVLKSPGRIEQLALEQGMVKPLEVEYIILESKKIEQVKETDEKKGLIAGMYSNWLR